MSEEITDQLYSPTIILINIALAVATHFLCRGYLLKVFNNFIEKHYKKWLDILNKNKIIILIAYLLPVIFLNIAISYTPYFQAELKKLVDIYAVIVVILIFRSLLISANSIYKNYKIAKMYPITSYIQLLHLANYLVGSIAVISLILDRSPWGIISGIGAFTAVILIVFREALQAFSAGMQITINNLIEMDDWIVVPSFNANGIVIDQALQFIKVQNFDKAIVVVPTHKLLETGFSNWRGMLDSGGRRIITAIYLDQERVKILNNRELQELYKSEDIKNHLPEKKQNITNNLTLFRNYIYYYLRSREDLNYDDFTFMVKLRDPSENGVPLEMYMFCNSTDWSALENAKAEILEHLYAVAPHFGMRIFQTMSDLSIDTNK
jgi:miniconductance mechanosensitive channel